jgi:hypothetical protein
MKAFFNRLWSKRAVRATIWTLISLVTLYALLVSIENWTGARALAAAKERVVTEGESLDFMSLVPPLPPDPENFCALPPLAGLTDAKHTPAEELKALEAIAAKVPDHDSSVSPGAVPDWKPWIEHLAKNGIGTADATPAAMLAALDAAHPVLKTLADAAPQHRAAQFTPRIGENHGNGAIFELPMPHYNLAQRLARVLLLRCHLAIAAGQAEDALHCLQASLRLCEACLREPVLISQLVSCAIHSMAMDRVRVLLNAHIATGADLDVLRQELGRLDFPSAMLQAMRGELAGATQTLESIRRRPDVLDILFTINYEQGRSQSLVQPVVKRILPLGYIDHSEAVIIDRQLDWLILPTKRGGYPELSRRLKELEASLAGRGKLSRPHHLLANLMMPAYGSVVRRISESETRRRQALAAITIEQSRLATGALPPSLPEGILDIIDGKPMRYRITGGGYLLWSVAHDGEDDGGRVADKGERSTDAKFTGDWVWGYGD